MPGGKVVAVPMHPPVTGATKTSSAAEWKIDFGELERAISARTKMIVINTPRKWQLDVEFCLHICCKSVASLSEATLNASEADFSLTVVIDNPVGKVYSREELERLGDICLKNNIIILSDEVYDRLFYVPFTRIATLSPEIENITITVGSAGKNFYATGWRVGMLEPTSLSAPQSPPSCESAS